MRREAGYRGCSLSLLRNLTLSSFAAILTERSGASQNLRMHVDCWVQGGALTRRAGSLGF